jgi:hypothetical protein
MAIRVRNWKISFVEQHTEINPQIPLGVWEGNFPEAAGAQSIQPARRYGCYKGERQMNALLFGTDSRAVRLVAASLRTLP